MKAIHLIRCSVGAISIFTLAACESNRSQRYSGDNRDATDYPRNSDARNSRNSSYPTNRPRSDANWNTGDNRSVTDSRNQGPNQPEYRGTLDRVDTNSPAWQGRSSSNAGTGYSSNQQPSQNGQSNTNAGTGYSNPQQPDASRDGQYLPGTSQNQPTGRWNDANPNANTPTGTYNIPSQPNQDGQWNRNTRRNANEGSGYSDNQTNAQSQYDNRGNQPDGTRMDQRSDRSTWNNHDNQTNNQNDADRNVNREHGERHDRNDSRRSDLYHSSSRDTSSWYRSGPDNRNDGGGYSAALIYPERYRGYKASSSRPMPRDSGAGTGYPMSWQRSSDRDGNRYERSGMYGGERGPGERWDDHHRMQRDDARSDSTRRDSWNRKDRDDHDVREDRSNDRNR